MLLLLYSLSRALWLQPTLLSPREYICFYIFDGTTRFTYVPVDSARFAFPRRTQPTFAKATMDAVGREGFEPSKQLSNRFTVCPIWPLWYLPGTVLHKKEPMEGFEPPTS
jgi:hypothetical protein